MNTKLKPSKKQLREFGIFVGFFFPFFIGWFLPSLFGHNFRIWTLYLGLPLIFTGIIAPSSLRFIYKKWIQIGEFLGFINGYLILGLIFILVMQPISLIMKLFGYDPLKKKSTQCKSYREERLHDNINLDKIF